MPAPQDPREVLATEFRKLIGDTNASQAQIAERMGLSKSTLHGWQHKSVPSIEHRDTFLDTVVHCYELAGRLDGDDRERIRLSWGRLLDAARDRGGAERRNGPAPSHPPVASYLREPGTGRLVRASPSDTLRRVRHRSDLAVDEAGRVPRAHMLDREAVSGEFAAGLYVRRDIEDDVLRSMESGQVPAQLIVGEPGVGKTSLLWGLAHRLMERGDRAVFWIKAAWLTDRGDEGRSPESEILAAVEELLGQGTQEATVLVDTADLIASDEHAQVALRTLLERSGELGVPVVVTSRPAEAERIRGKANNAGVAWVRRTLGPYSTALGSNGEPDEFLRAVQTHTHAYCRFHEGSELISAELRDAVARRQPLEQLCLRPLTLRMLFEVYAPGRVPGNIDVTDLYQDFWDSRVRTDRRVWVPGCGTGGQDDDLSETVRLVAMAMLRRGLPEVREHALRAEAGMEWGLLRADLDELCRRGVGEWSAGVFRFFHQTFFEFAAAQALLAGFGERALEVLGERCWAYPGDFVRITVFEQTWLCAWRREETAGSAFDLAERSLRMMAGEADTGEIPYALRQVVLRVLFQAPRLSAGLYPLIERVVAAEQLPVLRDALGLLPPPNRTLEARDVGVLARCVDRDDAAWATVVGVLSRSAYWDASLTLRAVLRVGLVDRLLTEEVSVLAARLELPTLLVRLSSEDTAALEEVIRSSRPALAERKSSHLANVLQIAAEEATAQPDVLAEWADRFAGFSWGPTTQGPLRPLAAIHRQRVIAHAASHGWDTALEELKNLVREIAQAGKNPGFPMAGRLGGLLLAFGESAPKEYGSRVADILASTDDPKVIAEAGRGWLIPLMRAEGCSIRSEAVERWLVPGLRGAGIDSEDRRRPSGPERWAEALLKTLAHPDTPGRVAGDIAAEVFARSESLTGWEAWLDPEGLLRLLLRGVLVEVPEACEALEKAADSDYPLPGRGSKILATELRTIHTDPEENDLRVRLALRRGDHHCVLVRAGDLPGSWHLLAPHAVSLEERIREGLDGLQSNTQSQAARLYDALVENEVLPLPEWGDLSRWLETSRAAGCTASLLRIAHLGLMLRKYPYQRVREVLAAGLRTDGQGALLRQADVTWARRLLVSADAAWGGEGILPALWESAFFLPVDSTALTYTANFIQPAHRRAPGPGAAARRDYLIEFGTRLESEQVPDKPCRDVSARLRGTVGRAMAMFGKEDIEMVLDAVPRMHRRFAAVVAQQSDAAAHPGIRGRLEELLLSGELPDVVARALRETLKQADQEPGADRWWDLALPR
ncbi:NACHT domain-containing NTPase [Nocardiopsis sp. CC223A]|uniref:NACHT domain-containing protein n=1 Tax=Nocardiopsis sp. CC223A TaxID=3044051 RepID=UPI00278BDCB5|nr:NACHT domain-containing protein [Nocardiopsis sp. CC223A]